MELFFTVEKLERIIVKKKTYNRFFSENLYDRNKRKIAIYRVKLKTEAETVS